MGAAVAVVLIALIVRIVQRQSPATVLGGLKPEVLIGQGLNVVTAVTSTDYRGIVAGLQRLPQQIFTGDIPGAHKTAGDLNNMLSPWVTMA